MINKLKSIWRYKNILFLFSLFLFIIFGFLATSKFVDDYGSKSRNGVQAAQISGSEDLSLSPEDPDDPDPFTDGPMGFLPDVFTLPKLTFISNLYQQVKQNPLLCIFTEPNETGPPTVDKNLRIIS